MCSTLPSHRAVLAVLAIVWSLNLYAQEARVQRKMVPEDLFRVRQVGAIAWSPDGLYAALELSKPGRTLDTSVPTNEIAILDVRARMVRSVSSREATYVGFFNPAWSPDGRRLAFLSVDSNAIVRCWIWAIGTTSPTPLRDVDVRVSFGDPPIAWIGDDRLAVVEWEAGAPRSGDLYFRILRGRNVATEWKHAVETEAPSVSVLESGRQTTTPEPSARLVAINLRTGARAELARGGIHRLKMSGDRRFIAFLKESPGVPGQSVASYFERATDLDGMYDAVNWGTELHVLDSQSGAEVAPSFMPAAPSKPAPKTDSSAAPPRADAHLLSTSPSADAGLYIANAPDGTHLWLAGGAHRPMSSYQEVWKANDWVSDVRTGRAEPIEYTTSDGTPLVAWLLLPPEYVPGTKLPMITIVYPGTIYRAAAPPSSFSLFRTDFEHPQLFAALGYAVLMPTMPPPKHPGASHSLAPLVSGVLPAVDVVISRGIADPDRIAVVGQSDGGFATLGLLTQTARFRSAIASAGFSDLTSLYGTFYGQYRHGDAGPPQKGQVLRMLQMEKGVFGLGGPPWAHSDTYRAESPLLYADKVQTPLMLVHGDLDFIPIQQAEEFFTALYRQDKRAVFVRYEGEWHSIANRGNVLDLWRRMGQWLSETIPPRR
jgi:dipeptidyl aminopeptidase/acylaminoacyl peptidase